MTIKTKSMMRFEFLSKVPLLRTSTKRPFEKLNLNLECYGQTNPEVPSAIDAPFHDDRGSIARRRGLCRADCHHAPPSLER